MITRSGRQPEATQTLAISGMTCGGCATSIQRALSQVPGVVHVAVDLATGVATIGGTASKEALAAAIEAVGYSARPLNAGPRDSTGGGLSQDGCCG